MGQVSKPTWVLQAASGTQTLPSGRDWAGAQGENLGEADSGATHIVHPLPHNTRNARDFPEGVRRFHLQRVGDRDTNSSCAPWTARSMAWGT